MRFFTCILLHLGLAIVWAVSANAASRSEITNFVSHPHVVQQNLKKFERNYFNANDDRRKLNFIRNMMANTSELNIHRMNGQTGNQVYTTGRNGRYEIVVSESGTHITDCANMGSLNYANVETEPLLHFILDMWPWLEFGNCAEDLTTKTQRVDAYLLDLKSGARLALEYRDDQQPRRIKLSNGQWQVVALFLKILRSSPGSDLSKLSGNDVPFIEEEFESVFEEFANGFRTVIVDDE